MSFLKPYYYERDIPADYTERGAELGARFAEGLIDNEDVRAFYEGTRNLNVSQTLAFVASFPQRCAPSTVLIEPEDIPTEAGGELILHKQAEEGAVTGAVRPNFFILNESLNRIRHLNTLLNRANEALEDGGYFWCHSRTSSLKRKVILGNYLWGINYVVYALHYLWHKVCPKLCGPTRKLYFAVTNGENRTYSRVEILGRFYRAGFEVVDEEFRHGEFYVFARKATTPIWDDEPTGSPVIKLRRVGKDGKIIPVYKFRTMYSYSEYLQPYIYEHNKLDEGGKFKNDYRVNFWGRLLRKCWLDELPMIANLVKGDIKLIGVRPISKHYFSLYTKEMQELRTRTKPGLLPPFYYENESPKNIEEVQESEKKYIEQYLVKPCATDWKYFWGIVENIVFRRKRSK